VNAFKTTFPQVLINIVPTGTASRYPFINIITNTTFMHTIII
jgi:hypothetical protein